MSRLARRAVLLAACVLLVITTVAVWLHLQSGTGRVTTAAPAAVAVLVLAAPVAAVAVGAARYRVAVLAAAVVTVAGAWTQAPLWIGTSAPDGRRLTVAQSNIKLGDGDVEQLARTVIDARADIVTVCELTPAAAQRLSQTALRTELPYQYLEPGRGGVGTAILSRFPLSDTVLLPGYALNSLRATADVPGVGPTVVYALHPIPPYPYTPSRWVREMTALRAELAGQRSTRVVIGGDLNATWDHRRFRDLLDAGYADAVEQSGVGWAPTYPADRWFGPLIGIDHVLARGFIASDVRSFSVARSDHRGLIATLAAG